MYLFFTKTDQKAFILSMMIHSFLASGVLFLLLQPSQPISFFLFWFVSLLAFQLQVLMLPEFIQKYRLKSLSSFEERRNLKIKMQSLQEEMNQIRDKDRKGNS